MKSQKIAVIGVGKYGSATARKLASRGAEVYCFDPNLEKIENIKEDVALAVALDATDKKALQSQNIHNVDAAIVAIGDNFEAVVLATVNLLELKVPGVISRASGENQKKILKKLGVQDILTPEEEVASVVTERLLNPSILSFLELPDNYEIAEVKAPGKVMGRTIGDINFRNRYKLTLVTVKRACDGANGDMEVHTLGVPTSSAKIGPHDTLVVFGTAKDVARFLEVNS